MTVIYKERELDQLIEDIKKDKERRKIFLLPSCSSETLKIIKKISVAVNSQNNHLIGLAEKYLILEPCSEERFKYDTLKLIDDSLEDTIVKYY